MVEQIASNNVVLSSNDVSEVRVLSIEDYGALDVVSEYSIYFVPIMFLIAGYVMMRILSMRDERL